MNIDKTICSDSEHESLTFSIHEDYRRTTVSTVIPTTFAQMPIRGNFPYRYENGGGDAGLPFESRVTISNSISTMVNIEMVNNCRIALQQHQQQHHIHRHLEQQQEQRPLQQHLGQQEMQQQQQRMFHEQRQEMLQQGQKQMLAQEQHQMLSQQQHQMLPEEHEQQPHQLKDEANKVPGGEVHVQVQVPLNLNDDYVIHPQTIFVTHMNHSISKHDIELYFSRAGRIQKDSETGRPKIFAYKNKYTGQSRGEATITYEEVNDAQLAIVWFNNSEFCGRKIKVMQAYISMDGENTRFDYARQRNPLMRRNRREVWHPAADNWICPLCRNSNFVWRASCNRCKADRVDPELLNQQNRSARNHHKTRQWRPLHTDWQCGFCFNTNFCYRHKCNRCGSPRDDNSCQNCQVMNPKDGCVFESSATNGIFETTNNANDIEIDEQMDVNCKLS